MNLRSDEDPTLIHNEEENYKDISPKKTLSREVRHTSAVDWVVVGDQVVAPSVVESPSVDQVVAPSIVESRRRSEEQPFYRHKYRQYSGCGSVDAQA
jgi:hypothetical protein